MTGGPSSQRTQPREGNSSQRSTNRRWGNRVSNWDPKKRGKSVQLLLNRRRRERVRRIKGYFGRNSKNDSNSLRLLHSSDGISNDRGTVDGIHMHIHRGTQHSEVIWRTFQAFSAGGPLPERGGGNPVQLLGDFGVGTGLGEGSLGR